MPITLRTTEMAYRDNSGQYVGINGVSERTTAEQIAAVEAAGEHVLEDVIPHDWTELTEDFDDIKEKIVMSSTTEPDEENNRIWLKPMDSETAIPTNEEFTEAKTAFETSTSNFILGPWTDGKRFSIPAVGSTLDMLNPGTAAKFSCIVVNCSEGDEFVLTTSTTSSSYRAYGWCDNNGVVISRAGSSELSIANKLIECPTGATKLVINAVAASAHIIIKNRALSRSVNDLRGFVRDDNTISLFTGYPSFGTNSNDGVNYEWNSDNTVCNLSGEATGNSFHILINKQQKLPDWIKPGSNIKVEISGNPEGSYIHLWFYPSTLSVEREFVITKDTIVHVPSECVGVLFRMDVDKDTVFPAGGVDVKVKVHCNYDINNSFRELSEVEAKSITSFEDISKRFHCSLKGSEISAIDSFFEGKLEANTQYIINAYPYTITAQKMSSGVIEIFNGGGTCRFIGYKTDSIDSIVWSDVTPIKQNKPIKILCLGNSFTEDENDYLPALLKEALPNQHFVIGILYKGGCSLEEHWDMYSNQSTYSRYSEYTDADSAWTIESDKTMQYVLAKNDWDVVTFQQASSDGTTYSTYQPYLNDLINAIQSTLSKNVRFVLYLYHAYAQGYTRTGYDGDSDAQYAAVSAAVQEAYAKTAISEVIPTGTAVQNARTTTLDSLGTYGHLTYDGMHLQEGIPCLIPAYVSFLKICEWIGHKEIGVLGSQVLPDATWVSAQNIPGQNGSSVGATAANRLIAAKCAIAAIKNPFTKTDCSNM